MAKEAAKLQDYVKDQKAIFANYDTAATLVCEDCLLILHIVL